MSQICSIADYVTTDYNPLSLDFSVHDETHMRNRTFALDRLLAQIIQSPHFSSFTISQLRMEYMRVLRSLSSPSSTQVRRYVYKQVGRLVRLGWVAREGEPMSRHVQYQVKELPKGITLDLIEPPFWQESPAIPQPETARADNAWTPAHGVSSLQVIESKLKQVRMDFIATLGEAETYKSILADHPCLREKLEQNYHKARDQSSNLMGQLRALEQAVKVLEPQQ